MRWLVIAGYAVANLVLGLSHAGPTLHCAEYDIVIRHGQVIDGSGQPPIKADIGIKHGRIAFIGSIPADQAAEQIDATNLIVAPGFIDMMGQSATPLMLDPTSARNLLTQGITTINAGEGSSAAPLDSLAGATQGWTTMSEYLALLDLKGLPVNVTQTVGHTQVRRLILGDTDRRPSPEELTQMQGLVREAMQAGAIGLSTALIYPPAVYATTQEITALASEAGKFGGRYYTHMRNEGDRLLEAIDEALDIGQSGQLPVHIFHLKAAGQQNWHKMPLAINKIQAARASGQQVAADVYPYIHNGLSLTALVHPKHFANGARQLLDSLSQSQVRAAIQTEMEQTDGWENWYRHVNYDWNHIILGRTSSTEYRKFQGQSFATIASDRSVSPWEIFFDLLPSNTFVLPQSMSEANLKLAMQQDFIAYCTDVGPAVGNAIAGHPRAFGAFPRLVARYTRDAAAITLPHAIAGASALAAQELMARNRGILTVGAAADIIVFDYEAFTDQATFAQPEAVAEGMRTVLVNGVPVLRAGVLTDARPGTVLRGPGYREETAPWALKTGELPAGLESFDRILGDFMQQHHIPGMAVAVTRHGRTVMTRGYGYADLAARAPVTARTLFRIASLSKPLTAVAILRLIEQGKLSLDQPVLEVLDYQADIQAAGDRFDPRWRAITVRHLLQHRGGWDRDQSFDAMFQSRRFAEELEMPAPATPAAIIRCMLRQKLDFAPGERYAYSNFGYCLLGRIIEHLSGQSYEAYVQQTVLAPLGISDMRLGRTRLADRANGESRYYQPGLGRSVFAEDLGQQIPLPYGHWCLESMDAHGGWLASAEDCARFAAAFDDPENCTILNRATIELMHQRPEGLAGYNADGTAKATYYSLGWNNRVLPGDKGHSNKVHHWHTGSLDGTATILIRRFDGINLIALLNTRASPKSNHLGREVDALLHKAANSVEHWPE